MPEQNSFSPAEVDHMWSAANAANEAFDARHLAERKFNAACEVTELGICGITIESGTLERLGVEAVAAEQNFSVAEAAVPSMRESTHAFALDCLPRVQEVIDRDSPFITQPNLVRFARATGDYSTPETAARTAIAIFNVLARKAGPSQTYEDWQSGRLDDGKLVCVRKDGGLESMLTRQSVYNFITEMCAGDTKLKGFNEQSLRLFVKYLNALTDDEGRKLHLAAGR